MIFFNYGWNISEKNVTIGDIVINSKLRRTAPIEFYIFSFGIRGSMRLA